MADQRLASLPTATQEKINTYKSLLKQPTLVPFWDIVVLSSGDEEQQKSYQQQIALKKSRKEIPDFVKYVVTCDPVGAKIGNGGATMHVLEELKGQIDPEELKNAKIFLVHAGGYSQRLPNVSVIGKAFMALPCGDPMFHMLDALLIMYLDLPARMSAGVFLTASDVIFLYDGRGDWNMCQPGVTAIAHPASLEIATTHGVFVLKEVEEIITKYRQDTSRPSMMGEADSFLHKASRKILENSGAKIPGTDEVYVDIGYYFDWPTAEKLVKFYSEVKPLRCEIDAYGDFLQALGPQATSDYCSNTTNVTFDTGDLVETRKKVFNLLHGTPLHVAIFNQAQFNHVGTTAEYIQHLFSNNTLRQAFGFQGETMVAETGGTCEDDEVPRKKAKRSLEDCVIMHSVLQDRNSVSIGEETVVEYCVLEPQVSIGKKCIISNLHLPAGVSVPDSSFLHTVPLVQEDGDIQYTTFAFDIGDSMKSSVSKENAQKLQYCSKNMGEALKVLFGDISLDRVFLEDTVRHSLWHGRLFPVFATRSESATCAVHMMQQLRQENSPSPLGLSGEGLVSVADMLKTKSIQTVLSFHDSLRQQIADEK